jgi:hypothetical protein
MSKSGFKKLTAVLIAAVLIAAATSAVALANVGGYEKMKEALFQTMKAESITIEINAAIKQNGETIATAEILSKANKDREYNKVISTDVNNEYAGYENYHVSKYGPVTESLRQSESMTEKERRLFSVLMDVFAGEMRNRVITNGNSASIDLNETQIPELYQLIAGVSAESIVSNDAHVYNYYDDPIQERFIDMAATKDFSIRSARAEASATDDGYIDFVKIYGEVGGYNDSGEYLSSSFEMDVNIYDVNNTEVPPLSDSDSYPYYSY